MKMKVSLREIVATKIVYALILASYYWMWARDDWKSYYQTIQLVLGVAFFVFFLVNVGRYRKYKRENWDEMAEHNLKRCDSICLKLFVSVMSVTAFAGAILSHLDTAGTSLIGWIIILSVVAVSVVRAVLFSIMDSKGV